MKGEKVLASGNVWRWEVTETVERTGIGGYTLRAPTAEDVAEMQSFALSLVPAKAVPEFLALGLGQEGMRQAKAAFDISLGRSSN